MKVRRFTRVAVVSVLLASLVGPAAAQQPVEEIHESQNFRLTIPAGLATPATIEATLQAFEDARVFLLGELGYQAPPVEGKYQLYTSDVGEPETRVAPGGRGDSDPSFIVLPASFLGAGTDLRLVAVHEYFHAIQYGYNSDSESWIREASSSWVEGVYAQDPSANVLYLPAFVPQPRSPLDSLAGLAEYGAFIFLQYLVERFEDRNIVRELWNEIAVPEAVPGAPAASAFEALATVLGRRGLTLDKAWGEFHLWRFRLRRHFEFGEVYARVLRSFDWPAVLRTTRVRSDSCRLDANVNDIGLPRLSGDYVRLRPAKKGLDRATAQLAVDGPPGTVGFFLVKPRREGAREQVLEFDAEGVAIAEVPFGRREVARITVGLANGSVALGAATLAYSLRLTGEDRVAVSPPSAASATDFGTGVGLSGSVTCKGRPAPFADVLVTAREIVSGAEEIFEVETNEFGGWSLGVTPEANTRYSAEVVDPLLASARSEPTVVEVRVVVTLEVAQSRIPDGSPVVLSGELQPAHPNVEVIAEYRRPRGPWLRGAVAITDGIGRYGAQFVLPNRGIWEVRTRVEDTGDRDHVGNTSGTRLVEVTG